MPKTKKAPMKICPTDLVLELTRRCNMRCADCMRGDAEDLDMPKRLIDNVFSACDEILTLTFTGGEPSLVPELIRYALSCARKYKVRIPEVYLATNGKEVPDKFLSALLDWHMYCLSCGAPGEEWLDADMSKRIIDVRNQVDERAGVHVSLSMDYYHDDIPRGNVLKLCTLPNINTDKYHGTDPNDDSWILSTGRAYWNGIGDTPVDHDRPWAYGEQATEIDLRIDGAGDARYDGQLYVNACGQLMKNCDYSYEDQDEYVLGCIDPVQEDRGWVKRLYDEHLDDPVD